MAGIGFELRKIFNEKSLLSVVKVYLYSAILSSGPWIISIITIIFIGLLKIYLYGTTINIMHFQVSVTYILMMSLIFSSPIHLSFSKYVADIIFEEQDKEILPSIGGVIFVIFTTGILMGLIFSYIFLNELSILYQIIFIISFVVISAMWVCNIVLLGLKEYKKIVMFYVLAYLIIMFGAIFLANKKLETLLASFAVGNIFLFISMVYLIAKKYPSMELINFSFFKRQPNWYLVVASFLYNFGIWIDKIIFWFSSKTGSSVLGKLHASIVYDPPIFLAYLSMIPAMSLFFYRLEANFAIIYDFLFNAIREDGRLSDIKRLKNDLKESIRMMIREIVVVQGIFNLIIFLFSPTVFSLLKIPQLYLPLFYIDLFGVQMQIGFMAMLSVIYYMDKQKEAVIMSSLFFILNFVLTYITIYLLGPFYFGYGFAVSSMVSFVASIIVLEKKLKELEYETFMFN